MKLKIIETDPDFADENMEFDAQLLDSLSSFPILHLYAWKNPSITYGYFVDPKKYLNLEKLKIYGIDLARRPTGGGIVFHLWDLAFSFLMPASHSDCSNNSLSNYHFVNSIILDCVRSFLKLNEIDLISDSLFTGNVSSSFCMATPTKYDVMYLGKKVAGAAQRKKKQGYLHQGTISLALPDFSFLSETLLVKEEILENMERFTFSPLKKIPMSLEEGREKMKILLKDKFMEKLSTSLA